MKLTEIAIEEFEGCRNTRLSPLSEGLNIVFSNSAAIKSVVRDFLAAIFYRPRAETYRNKQLAGGWPMGHVNIRSGGHGYQLARPASTTFGELAISDLSGSHLGHRTPDLLQSLDQSAYEAFFEVHLGSDRWASNQQLTNFVAQLIARFDVSTSTTPFAGDVSEFEQWKAAADLRRARAEEIHRKIHSLTEERSQLVGRQESTRIESQERLSAIEQQISGLQNEANSIHARIDTERRQRAGLDRQIHELSQRIDSAASDAGQVPVSTSRPDPLVILYDRLDEIDNQIRRWRIVQSDIQHQRVQIRDEMVISNELSIESADHPYHDARQILMELESKVDRTEKLAQKFQEMANPVEDSRRLATSCGEMRDDLYALCQELGRQYRHVRHKAAVAELKQLRRCYHEMDENIRRLLLRRDAVIEDIRALDAAGADAIVRADQQFCQSAQREGYLQARRKFVEEDRQNLEHRPLEYRTIGPDLIQERNQLTALKTRRNEWSIHLLETELRQVELRLAALIDERSLLAAHYTSDVQRQLQLIDDNLAELQNELNALQGQIDDDQKYEDWKPDYLLSNAARYLYQLTDGRLQQVWIDSRRAIRVRGPANAGTSDDYLSLAAADRDCVRLSLALAAANQFALRGIRFPMVVHEDQQNPVSTSALVATLDAYCGNGLQAFLLTGNREATVQGQTCRAAVFELADTEITVPAWYPDTPIMPREDVPRPTAARNAVSYPGPEHERPTLPPWELTQPSVGSSPIQNSRSIITRDVFLQDVDLVESIYLTPLEALGIRTIGQLLDLDVANLGADLIRRGFNPDQIHRWQSQSFLLICLPELTTSDARVLVGCGIYDLELLLQLDSNDLLERVKQYLDSSAGRRSNVPYSRFDANRIRGWQNYLRDNKAWRNLPRRVGSSSGYQTTPSVGLRDSGLNSRRPAGISSPASRVSNNRPKVRHTKTKRPSSRVPRAPATRTSRRGDRSTGKYRFYLDPSDDICSAPSIGAKTAERFHGIGVRTVYDFLYGSPDQMADDIDYKRINANTIETWQNQTRMMVAVPNLRSHDAQILVACGIDQPNALAAMDAEELLSIVEPFSASKEGMRILRNGKKPDLEEVSGWIDSANHRRVLKAA